MAHLNRMGGIVATDTKNSVDWENDSRTNNR
jgi:hypothetical protein